MRLDGSAPIRHEAGPGRAGALLAGGKGGERGCARHRRPARRRHIVEGTSAIRRAPSGPRAPRHPPARTHMIVVISRWLAGNRARGGEGKGRARMSKLSKVTPVSRSRPTAAWEKPQRGASGVPFMKRSTGEDETSCARNRTQSEGRRGGGEGRDGRPRGARGGGPRACRPSLRPRRPARDVDAFSEGKVGVPARVRARTGGL